VTVNVAEEAPNGIVTVPGTPATEALLFRVTTSPAGPASPLIVTVPVTVVVDPPTTVVGDNASEVSVAGWTVSTQV